jgi:hypothetical protein
MEPSRAASECLPPYWDRVSAGASASFADMNSRGLESAMMNSSACLVRPAVCVAAPAAGARISPILLENN